MWAMEDWLTVVSGYIGLRKFPLPYDARFRDRLTILLEEFYDLETLWQIYFHKVYDVRRTDTCIVDAGANIGLFCCWAARVAPQSRIFAIEPFPKTFKRLELNLRRNSLEQRVQCLNLALSRDAGIVTMSESGLPSQNFRVLTEDESETKPGVKVNAVPLSQIITSLPSEQIDLLKIDIEGSEYEVLLSTPPSQFARVDRLSVEYHETRLGECYSKYQLIDHLQGSGFALTGNSRGNHSYGLLHFGRSRSPAKNLLLKPS